MAKVQSEQVGVVARFEVKADAIGAFKEIVQRERVEPTRPLAASAIEMQRFESLG